MSPKAVKKPARKSATARKESTTFVLTFPARVVDENGKKFKDAKQLAKLDGLRDIDKSDLAEYVLPNELGDGLDLRSAVPVLRFDKKNAQLYVELPLRTNRPAKDMDLQRLAMFAPRQAEGPWGLNASFVLPNKFPEDARVEFDVAPREKIPNFAQDALKATLAKWKGADSNKLDQKSEEELQKICDELNPLAEQLRIASVNGNHVAYLLGFYLQAANARRRHRKIDKIAPEKKINLDNIDDIDKLPKDFL